jgi:TP901-1 family phage major tail protein
MAAGSGRRVRISQGSGIAAVVVAGARSDTLTINNEPIDITDKDDLGWTTLLADASTRNISLSVEGVLKGDTLLAVAAGANSGLLAEYEVEVETVGTFVGDWFINSFETGGAHDGENTFSASLSSSGSVAYTAAP